jgi:hypothetical protein
VLENNKKENIVSVDASTSKNTGDSNETRREKEVQKHNWDSQNMTLRLQENRREREQFDLKENRRERGTL